MQERVSLVRWDRVLNVIWRDHGFTFIPPFEHRSRQFTVAMCGGFHVLSTIVGKTFARGASRLLAGEEDLPSALVDLSTPDERAPKMTLPSFASVDDRRVAPFSRRRRQHCETQRHSKHTKHPSAAQSSPSNASAAHEVQLHSNIETAMYKPDLRFSFAIVLASSGCGSTGQAAEADTDEPTTTSAASTSSDSSQGTSSTSEEPSATSDATATTRSASTGGGESAGAETSTMKPAELVGHEVQVGHPAPDAKVLRVVTSVDGFHRHPEAQAVYRRELPVTPSHYSRYLHLKIDQACIRAGDGLGPHVVLVHPRESAPPQRLDLGARHGLQSNVTGN